MESQAQVIGQQRVNGKSTLYSWLVCGLGALFYCYEYFLRISPSVMTQDLMRVYNIDAALLGHLAAFYYYAYTPMQLPVGMLMDRYGPRRLLILASILCAVGTYLFAESGYLMLAQIGRFMVGFGSAFAFVGVLKLATIWLPPQRFAMIAGLATALGMMGAAFGDIWLAEMVNSVGWHNTILISATMGVVLALAILLALPDDDFAFTEAEKPESASYKQLVVGLLQLIKNPQVWLVGLVGCLLYLPTSVFAELWGIHYFESVYHFSKTAAAGAVSMIFLGWAAGGPIAGFISDKLKLRRTPMFVGSLVSAALVGAILYLPALDKVTVYCLLFIFGMFSSVENIVFAIGREVSPHKLAGTAIALTNMFVMLGGVFFQPIVGVLLDMGWDGAMVNGIHAYSVTTYKWALSVLPVGVLLAAVVSLFVKETHCKVVES